MHLDSIIVCDYYVCHAAISEGPGARADRSAMPLTAGGRVGTDDGGCYIIASQNASPVMLGHSNAVVPGGGLLAYEGRRSPQCHRDANGSTLSTALDVER